MAGGQAMLPRVEPSPGGLARGRSGGAFILGLFGAAWFWLASVNSPGPHLAQWALIALGAGAIVAASFVLDARAKRLPAPPRNPAIGRGFLLINLAQWLAAGLAVVLLVRAGAGDWVPAAVALVVGLHFLPLAHMFRSPVQYATGAALVVAALLFNRHFLPVLLSAGTVLWLTALAQLAHGFRLSARS